MDPLRHTAPRREKRSEWRYGSLMRRSGPPSLFLHPPAFIDASDTMKPPGHMMREIGSNALFVRDRERVGIITSTCPRPWCCGAGA